MKYVKKFKASDYSDCDFTEIENFLGYVPHCIWDIEYTVEYSVSDYIPATFHQEAEGGEISEVELIDVVVLIKFVDTVYGDTGRLLPLLLPEYLVKRFDKYLPQNDEFYLKLADID